MSDLISAVKSANWHTIVLLIPGLTFLLIVSKVYVDLQNSMQRESFTQQLGGLTARIESVADEVGVIRNSDIPDIRMQLVAMMQKQASLSRCNDAKEISVSSPKL